MELQFECGCGADISEFTRGDDPEFDAHIRCDVCGSEYIVTITQINKR